MSSRRAYGVLLLIITLFFLSYLVQGLGFLYGDNLGQRIPGIYFWKNEVTSGRLPLWNPYILGGLPFLADLSHNALSPTNIVYLVMSVPYAITALTIIYIAIAACATYAYVHSVTNKTLPSMFSAITFALSGTVIASVNDINSLQGITLVPLVLYGAHRFTEKANNTRALILIFALVFQFLSSHPQYSYYSWILVASYIVVFGTGKLKVRVAKTFAVFLFTLGLIAVQLLPFLELARESYRPQTSEFAAQNQLKIIELPSFILADLFGSWRSGSSWGPGAQLETGLANSEGYLGILPLLFAVIAVLKRKSKRTKYWVVAGLIALLLSLGNQTPLYELVRRALPLFSNFRSPIRMLSIYSFSVSVLAGVGLSAIKVERKRKK